MIRLLMLLNSEFAHGEPPSGPSIELDGSFPVLPTHPDTGTEGQLVSH